MIIYPTVELQNGKCVSLQRGRLEEASIWHVDPLETVHGFAAQGAEWIHVTDLDAVAGEGSNDALIEEMITTTSAAIQIGGGVRTADRAEYLIDKGAGRVVIGTLAVQAPQTVQELAVRHPDQIVLAVDIYQGKLMTEGWRNAGAMLPEDFLKAYDDVPLAGVIVTDIDADIGDDQEGHLGVISGLAASTKHPVIARGTVHTADDVSRLKYVTNISGTLVGRALFAKDVDLEEALALAQATPEPKAHFQ